MQFGTTLNKILEFDVLKNWFSFNADLLIEGVLKLTGNEIKLNNEGISDVDVFIVANQNTGSGGSLKYNSTNQEWELSNNGSSFSEILTADSTQTLTNKTINADQNNLFNINWDSIDFRTKTFSLIPEYQGVTLFGD